MLTPDPLQFKIYDGPAGATFGPNGHHDPYRYTLHRRWSDDGPMLVWIMCNPSTATDTVLDATVRRVQDFSRAWGYGGFVVVNAYALRSTNPAGLWRAEPIGPLNDRVLEQVFAYARVSAASRGRLLPRVVVAAWGAVAESGPDWAGRKAAIFAIADRVGVDLYALNYTKVTGAPVHPLRRPKAETLQLWREYKA